MTVRLVACVLLLWLAHKIDLAIDKVERLLYLVENPEEWWQR